MRITSGIFPVLLQCLEKGRLKWEDCLRMELKLEIFIVSTVRKGMTALVVSVFLALRSYVPVRNENV